MPGLEPGAVYSPDMSNVAKKYKSRHILSLAKLAHGGSSFSPAINMNKEKADLIDRPFLSAGARTRTWSLLVRSQTLYPVGLHPLDVPPNIVLSVELSRDFSKFVS